MSIPPMPISTRRRHLPDLVGMLQEAVRRAISLEKRILFSLTTSWETLDLLDLLQRADKQGLTRMYWSAPDSSVDMIGVGEVHRLSAYGDDRFQEMMDDWHLLLRDSIAVSVDDVGTAPTGPVLLGGFSFFTHASPDENSHGHHDEKSHGHHDDGDDWWSGFSDGLMICPQILVSQTKSRGTFETWLTQNAWVNPTSDALMLAKQMTDFAQSILEQQHHPEDVSLSVEIDERPLGDNFLDELDLTIDSHIQTEARFKQLVEQATTAIDDGPLRKIVIADYTDVAASHPFHAARVLTALSDQYPECTRFAVGIGPRTFVGATPERLVALTDRQVKVTCLAGSAPRDEDATQDNALGQALLNDPKNLVEHNWVVHMVRQALQPYCSQLEIAPRPALLRLSNVQHLYTPVRGVIDDQAVVNILSLVRSLHPTPAVGGYPQASSTAWLKEHEAMDRGWYAAPVGWMAPSGDGEFVVAIRSGLIHHDRARLFAGCGIVAGSEQHAEFLESQLKLAPMLRAIRRSLR